MNEWRWKLHPSSHPPNQNIMIRTRFCGQLVFVWHDAWQEGRRNRCSYQTVTDGYRGVFLWSPLPKFHNPACKRWYLGDIFLTLYEQKRNVMRGHFLATDMPSLKSASNFQNFRIWWTPLLPNVGTTIIRISESTWTITARQQLSFRPQFRNDEFQELPSFKLTT